MAVVGPRRLINNHYHSSLGVTYYVCWGGGRFLNKLEPLHLHRGRAMTEKGEAWFPRTDFTQSLLRQIALHSVLGDNAPCACGMNCARSLCGARFSSPSIQENFLRGRGFQEWATMGFRIGAADTARVVKGDINSLFWKLRSAIKYGTSDNSCCDAQISNFALYFGLYHEPPLVNSLFVAMGGAREVVGLGYLVLGI